MAVQEDSRLLPAMSGAPNGENRLTERKTNFALAVVARVVLVAHWAALVHLLLMAVLEVPASDHLSSVAEERSAVVVVGLM